MEGRSTMAWHDPLPRSRCPATQLLGVRQSLSNWWPEKGRQCVLKGAHASWRDIRLVGSRSLARQRCLGVRSGATCCNELALRRGIGLLRIERSEERRVGKEGVSTCRSRWSPSHEKKKKDKSNI